MYNNLGGEKSTRKKINLLCSKRRNLLSFLRAIVSYCFYIRCGHQSDKNSLFFLLKKEVCIWKYETLSMVVLSSPQTPKGSTALSIAISPSGSAKQFFVAVRDRAFGAALQRGQRINTLLAGLLGLLLKSKRCFLWTLSPMGMMEVTKVFLVVDKTIVISTRHFT